MAPLFDFPGACERGRRSGPEGRKGERRLSKELKTAIRTVAGTHVRRTYQGRIVAETTEGVYTAPAIHQCISTANAEARCAGICASRTRFSHPPSSSASAMTKSNFIRFAS